MNVPQTMTEKQPVRTGGVLGNESMEELFAALESPLLNYALRLTGASNTAEDLVQEAFMKLQEQFAEVREPRRWLYRTVHNLALNQQRQARKIIPMETRAFRRVKARIRVRFPMSRSPGRKGSGWCG